MHPPFRAVIFPCERLLKEVDGVWSAIRLVDIFYWNPQEDGSTDEEKRPTIPMNWYCHVKRVDWVKSRHRIRFTMIAPTEEESPVGVESEVEFASHGNVYPGAIIPVHLRMRPRGFGLYQLILYVDDQEVNRGFVTIGPPPDPDKA